MAWFLAKDGDAEDPDCVPYWMLMEMGEDGVASIFLQDEPLEKLQRVKAALEWQDTLGSGRMSLAQSGVVFNANTGRVWKAPKGNLEDIGIEISPAQKQPVARRGAK